ncbi:MAG: hypothetical protein ACQETB_00800 [Halobacteriota archaeon]
MTAPAHGSSLALEYSTEEAWVIHTAVVSYVESKLDAGADPDVAIELLGRIEAGEYRFEGDELERLRDVLVAHLSDAPLRDRSPSREVIRRVNATLRRQ